MDDDGESEIIRRLALLDRKLNYLIGLVLGAIGIGIATGVYFVVRSIGGELAAIVVAVAAGVIIPKALEVHFRRADP